MMDKREAGEQAMGLIDACARPEVEEAIEAFAKATFEATRALERADVPHPIIVGMLGGSVMTTVHRMASDD